MRGDRGIQKETLNLSEMVEVGEKDIALHGKIGEFALAGDLDQSGGLQLFDVMRKRGRCHGLFRAHFRTGSTVSACDLPEDLVTAWISKGPRDEDDLPVGQSSLSGNSHGGQL